MSCDFCAEVFGDHEPSCPKFEPPLTHAELRVLRSWLARGTPLFPMVVVARQGDVSTGDLGKGSEFSGPDQV